MPIPFAPVKDAGLPARRPAGLPVGSIPAIDPAPPFARGGRSRVACVDDPDEEDEDLGDDEELPIGQPTQEEESSFDDFDDDFDDDFEEEENDPDWDHPDESEPESLPPGKGGTRKK